jgi:hypothetical protein
VEAIFVSMFKWSFILFKSRGQSDDGSIYRETLRHARIHVEVISACCDTSLCFVPVKGMFTVASFGTLPHVLASKWNELSQIHPQRVKEMLEMKA